MKIEKFISSLLPSFEKGRVMEDLALLKEELRDTTLPPYQSAAEFYRGRKFKAQATQNYDKAFSGNHKIRITGNYVVVSNEVLKAVNERFDTVIALANKTLGRDITSGGMTYLKANLLQYIEAMSFASRYARKLLLWTLGEENVAANASSRIVRPLAKAEVEWLWSNALTYARCLTVLAIKTRDLETTLKVVPDLVVLPGETAIVEQTQGLSKTDPFSMGLIPIALNPIYHVRMAIAEWQVTRHKAAQEEKLALEYRLLALHEEANGKQDAKLEELISYTEGRLQKLNRKLAKMEEGLND